MVAAWFTALLGAGLVATALTASTLVRPRSCCRWLLVAYVVFVAETTAITTLLSPFAAVSRTGLGLAVGLTAVAVVTAWLRSGRPRPPAPELPRPHRADAALLVLALAVALSLAYEAVLVVAMPPNNWDSLTYHLARVAAWAQHGGVYWIPDAPTARMNEFQPLAEQQILVWFVATGRAALFALPQLLAQLAMVGAVFEVARKLGYAARASAFAALLFAAFPLVALEATTAQNDLVAAALPVLAVALILEGGFAEVAVAGVSTGLALGVKLTTLYALPVVLLLALTRDRRRSRCSAAGASSPTSCRPAISSATAADGSLSRRRRL
jgi:hypothetical protein